MHTYRDTAVVLRSQDLAEADRIITLLTEKQGLMRAVAKGVRRTRSKFGARLEVFNSIDGMLLAPRKADGLGIISSAHSLYSPAGLIAADYSKYSAACIIVEVAGRLSGVECAPTGKLLRLTLQALNAIAEGRRAYELIVLAYLMRAMAEAGWLPSLYNCASCGAPGPHTHFHVSTGGAICSTCTTEECSMPGAEVLHMMHAAYTGHWDVICPDDRRMHRRGLLLAVEYFRWHIGYNISSLASLLLDDFEPKANNTVRHSSPSMEHTHATKNSEDTMLSQTLSISTNEHTINTSR